MAEKIEKSEFYEGPDDLVFDGRAGMKVSRFGQDKGARKRDTVTDHAGMEDGVQLVTRVRNGLDRMRQNGSISDDAYTAAVLFQNEFEKCGYAKYVTLNLNRTGGGGGADDVMTRSQSARDYVGHVMRLLGGGNNPMTTVVFWSVGLGYGFERIAKAEGDSKHYWRGVFMAAIRIMEEDYRRMCRGKRRKAGHEPE